MELVKELLILLGRIITIIPLLLIITLLMGKRSIGELPVFDFLIIITLGAVVGADIADIDIKHIHTAVAVLAIGLFQVIVAKWKISNRKVGRWLTFEPTPVVYNGQLLVDNMHRIRYSIDNVLQMLREKDVFDINDVELALIEPNGRLTVHRKPTKANVTIEDMGIAKASPGIAYPVIVEGKTYHDVLDKLGLDEEWLNRQLSNLNIRDVDDIFFASVTEQGILHVTLNNDQMRLENEAPPLHH
ncbi:uncharacterized membrane protein YcaP (DUF421 family) [Caldalkalibacillus uzonensis]|uniref:Uncharacterized membrane protein YcaP (DUF421 family) n=1 Tax=Caldalkalibacillus uzonensis TaxID=353224 RepID=A0ABU0CVJ8_9BACI|nr:DUF421 domain-containing protein [Caldalkalibacillus uzonensis]MDQ0340450.1 uncharacterized membrane protein YcaP (DUF421 family) [Caldalkalibacillus uzonensis]